TGTFDPDYALQADGTIWATTFDGLRVTRDGGCTWDIVGGAFGGLWIGEVEVGPDGKVWVATSSGDVGVTNDVYVSSDGTQFDPTGLLHANAWWRTLRVAPSDGQRIYVTGYVPPQPDGVGGQTPPEVLMYRSENGGDTWSPTALTGVVFGDIPSLELKGVSPANPDIVFAVAVAASAEAGDVLYRSTDKGETWTEILSVNDFMPAFLALGDGTVVGGTVNDGVHVSTNGGDSFTRYEQPKMACVNHRSDGTFFSCGSNLVPDLFALGRSTDLVNWSPVMRFAELDGPLACPPGTIQYDVCASQVWPTLQDTLGLTPDAGPVTGDPDAGTTGGGGGHCDASGRPDAAVAAALALLLAQALRRRRSSAGRR
ncbi:MAG TPA: MYXO-CTERM sorting domain-containing protein, partial [Kofleriaceae bacterium]|nr:MYXO-CTERM sorting domain-containing protein [Kofleriaceae bacterium]